MKFQSGLRVDSRGSGKEGKESSQKLKGVMFVVLIAVVGVVLLNFFLFSFEGESSVENVRSFNVILREDLKENFLEYRVRANRIQSEDPNVRVDMTKDSSGVRRLIYNRENDVFYHFDSEENVWRYLPGSMGESIQRLALLIGNVVRLDGSDLSLEFENDEHKIVINEINPKLSSKIFLPPKGAEVENLLSFSP